MKGWALTLTAIQLPPQSQILPSKVWRSRADRLHPAICRIFYRPGTAIRKQHLTPQPRARKRGDRNGQIRQLIDWPPRKPAGASRAQTRNRPSIDRSQKRPHSQRRLSDRRRHPAIASRSNRNAMPQRRKLSGSRHLCARSHRQQLWDRRRSRSLKRNSLRPLKKVSPRLSIHTGNLGGGFSE